jgi:hypothetical protein
MQTAGPDRGARRDVVRPVPARVGGVRAGMASAVRLVTAAFLLGSVLLIMVLVGQGMAAAQQLLPSSEAGERAPATGPGVAGPSTAVETGGLGLGGTPAGRQVVAELDQAARTLQDTSSLPPAALDGGTRSAGTPGSSPQPVLPAPDFRMTSAKRLELAPPVELRGDGNGDDPQPGQQGVQVALVAAEAAPTVVAQRQPAGPIDIDKTAKNLLDTAETLAKATREHTKHDPNSIVKAGITPDPRTDPNPRVEQVRYYAAWAQALAKETRYREEAKDHLGDAAKSLGWEADWSMGVAQQLYKNAHALARQAGQGEKAQTIKAKHAEPLLKQAVDAWNQAIEVGEQLGDPQVQRRYNFEKVRNLFERQKDSLLDDPEPSQEGSRLAYAEAEPATPLAPAQPTAAQAAPATVRGDLDQTPLEAATFDPAADDSTLASTSEGTESPPGVQQASVTDGDTNGLASLDASLSPDDGGGVLTG